MYWYLDSGVVRKSDHWCGVATCYWGIHDNGSNIGFCAYNNFSRYKNMDEFTLSINYISFITNSLLSKHTYDLINAIGYIKCPSYLLNNLSHIANVYGIARFKLSKPLFERKVYKAKINLKKEYIQRIILDIFTRKKQIGEFKNNIEINNFNRYDRDRDYSFIRFFIVIKTNIKLNNHFKIKINYKTLVDNKLLCLIMSKFDVEYLNTTILKVIPCDFFNGKQ